MPTFAAAGGKPDKKISINRTVNWKKGQKVKEKNKDFTWAPVEYDGPNMFPAVLTWREDQDYIPKLANYLNWVIVEGFITYKDEKGKTRGFLSQIAYDPLKHKGGDNLYAKNFTGMILCTTWDETILRGWRITDGMIEQTYNVPIEKNADGKPTTCVTYNTQFSTVYLSSCQLAPPEGGCIQANFTLHTVHHTYCWDETGGMTYNPSGSTTNPYGDPYNPGYPYNGSGGGSGSGNVTYFPPYYPDYNYQYQVYNLIHNVGTDRSAFTQRLNKALEYTGVGVGFLDATVGKADAIIKTCGIMTTQDIKFYASSPVGKFGPAIGAVGAVIGGAGLVIGWYEDGWHEDDTEDLGWFLLGVGGLLLGGWPALIIGGITVYVSIHDLNQKPQR